MTDRNSHPVSTFYHFIVYSMFFSVRAYCDILYLLSCVELFFKIKMSMSVAFYTFDPDMKLFIPLKIIPGHLKVPDNQISEALTKSNCGVFRNLVMFSLSP